MMSMMALLTVCPSWPRYYSRMSDNCDVHGRLEILISAQSFYCVPFHCVLDDGDVCPCGPWWMWFPWWSWHCNAHVTVALMIVMSMVYVCDFHDNRRLWYSWLCWWLSWPCRFWCPGYPWCLNASELFWCIRHFLLSLDPDLFGSGSTKLRSIVAQKCIESTKE